MATVHFENLLFLLFIFVALLFRVLTRAATKASKQSGETKPKSTTPPHLPPPTSARAPVETDQDRIRKFLQALGQPAGSAPPPPVKPRPIYEKPIILPHVGPGPSPLPPLTTRPPDLPREKRIFRPKTPPPAFEVHETAAAVEPTLPPVATPTAPYAIATQPEVVTADDKIGLVTLLRSPSGLRNAIILREIFGPPRSMQPIELL